MNGNSRFETRYQPHQVESALYDQWESNQLFSPKGDGPTFSMVMPPPNVTGELHMGHALNTTIQDIIARYKRLTGHNVLWIPGTDHAGIATQNVVDKQLQSDGISSADIGRDAFLSHVWDWKHTYGDRITKQIRRLGASVDWNYERFTMDDGCQSAVTKHFVDLYEKGLIYQGEYIVNWCPKNKTALSDIEVEYCEKSGHLWHIRYPLTNDSSTHLIVATTRPETMFGDTAVAVHPHDNRYKHMIGQTVSLPYCNRDIPIIADAHVDASFGSGAVKVTPAHDSNDFDIGNRHNLPRILVMDESATMNHRAPTMFQGMSRYECRRALVEKLTSDGYLHKIDDHVHTVGVNSRSGAVIEPILSKQWFINMADITPPAIDAVQSSAVTFIPKRWEKLYFEWMHNIRDWCISRQIWWGHRIPVWYCDNKCPIIVQETPPTQCPHCGSTHLTQDPDVLDTWFSSALWPFSAMGWPKQTETLTDFFPTSLLVTGYDILTFWVSRMITMSLANTNKPPFQQVYLHGLVRDITGKKMSKSIGNVINPLDIIDEYGADALRFGIASLCTKGGQDIKLSIEKIQSSRNFANKLYNVARFVDMCLTTVDQPVDPMIVPTPTTTIDAWILDRLNVAISTITHHLNDYNVASAADDAWEFIWNQWCDWYIEGIKAHKSESIHVLTYCCTQALILLHPIMPFVTDAIWQRLLAHPTIQTHAPNHIQHARWPTPTGTVNTTRMNNFESIFNVIREIRHLINAANLPKKPSLTVHLSHENASLQTVLNDHIPLIQQLTTVARCFVHNTPITTDQPNSQSVASTITIQLILPAIDPTIEMHRLTHQLQVLYNQKNQIDTKLNNRQFLDKAPSHVVKKTQTEAADLASEISTIEHQLNQLR